MMQPSKKEILEYAIKQMEPKLPMMADAETRT